MYIYIIFWSDRSFMPKREFSEHLLCFVMIFCIISLDAAHLVIILIVSSEKLIILYAP